PDGYPVVRTHAFGITTVEIVHRYPWTSCDSTTWLLLAGIGIVMIPRWRNNTYDYFTGPLHVIFSERPERQYEDKSFNRLNPGDKQYVETYLETIGTNPQQLRDRVNRVRANALYYLALQDVHTTEKIERIHLPRFSDGRPPSGMKIYLAGNLDWNIL